MLRLTRRFVVKIPFAQVRMSAATMMLVIALPILAACGGSPQPAAAPTPALPTAAPIATDSPDATAAPVATDSPDATAAPIATSSPKQNLEFGIVNHLYY